MNDKKERTKIFMTRLWMLPLYWRLRHVWKLKKKQQREVSIHQPLGYGPSTLALRHSAVNHCRWDTNPHHLE